MDGEARTPVQILELTRQIFAASHWVEGSYTSKKVLGENSDGTFNYKAVACSVGGIRYAALAPLNNALDEGWMLANMSELGENVPYAREYDPAALNYLRAVEALAARADEFRYDDYEAEFGRVREDEEPERIFERINMVEEIIVSWNDSHTYDSDEQRAEIVRDTILPVFDFAISKLKGAVTA